MQYRSQVLLDLGRNTYAIIGSSAAQLYTPLNTPHLRPGGSGNLIHELPGELNERFDWSGHGDSEGHVNYDIRGTPGSFSRDGLGEHHKVDIE